MALNILIVDDSIVARAMIKKTLRLAGLPVGETYEACNGEEGLRLLSDRGVDLALVDINMPVMNGEEMIHRMRAEPKTQGIPVVVISTEGSHTRIERLEQQGVTFIHKPFTPESLRDTLRQLVGSQYEATVG